MKAIDLLVLGREILKKMSEFGIRTDDWQYVEMYETFMRARREGEKYWNIVHELSERYGKSEATVIRVLRRLGGVSDTDT